MDDFDFKILDALQRDGQKTNYDLAELAGLSASQCSTATGGARSRTA